MRVLSCVGSTDVTVMEVRTTHLEEDKGKGRLTNVGKVSPTVVGLEVRKPTETEHGYICVIQDIRTESVTQKVEQAVSPVGNSGIVGTTIMVQVTSQGSEAVICGSGSHLFMERNCKQRGTSV